MSVSSESGSDIVTRGGEPANVRGGQEGGAAAKVAARTSGVRIKSGTAASEW